MTFVFTEKHVLTHYASYSSKICKFPRQMLVIPGPGLQSPLGPAIKWQHCTRVAKSMSARYWQHCTRVAEFDPGHKMATAPGLEFSPAIKWQHCTRVAKFSPGHKIKWQHYTRVTKSKSARYWLLYQGCRVRPCHEIAALYQGCIVQPCHKMATLYQGCVVQPWP